MHALSRLQQPAGAANAAPTVNVIRDLKAGPQGAALAPADALTIDIVAMLFDFVFEDRHVPVEVKAAIGRLQIPMVKVALIDRAFFSARSHPARRLLNRLAEASIGLDPARPRSSAAGPGLISLRKVVGARRNAASRSRREAPSPPRSRTATAPSSSIR